MRKKIMRKMIALTRVIETKLRSLKRVTVIMEAYWAGKKIIWDKNRS
jgi:hypothetical protein